MKTYSKKFTEITKGKLSGDVIRGLQSYVSESTVYRWIRIGLIADRGMYILTTKGYQLS